VGVRQGRFLFDAQDGFGLSASIFEPDPPGGARAAILLTAATGVKRRYYDGFATFLAENGLAVMSFDYRGVGDSLSGRLRGFRGDIQDWGTHDLPGALACLRSRHSSLPLLVVAHSVGGQILGFARNSDQISGLLCVSAQHGHWRNWPGRHAVLFAALCYLAMPALSHLLGYFPARILGLGDDLPKGIALGWARWARTRAYLDAVPFAPSGIPGRSYSFADDLLAPPKACDRLCASYPGVRWDRRHIEPADLGAAKVGHFGFFRDRFRDSLWVDSLRWLQATASRAS
jgi:predicted alpha/beta hydrolase